MAKINIARPYVDVDRALELLREVLESGWIGQADKCEEFERKVADMGYRWPVLLNSGTSALHLALILAGVGPGDEVITSSMTCTATNHPILYCGATPVFADIEYYTGNINADDIERKVTDKTKAILPIHWAGLPCDMDEINTIADAHGLPVIQDAAHALGSTYKGQNLSWVSAYACYSFQAIKLITMADGGMLTVSSPEERKRAKSLRWFSIDRDDRVPTVDGYWEHDVIETGYKYQPNDVMAAIGLANLPHYYQLLEQRRTNALIYREELKDVPGITLFQDFAPEERMSACWLFTMHVENRDEFCRAMRAREIDTSIVHRRNDVFTVFGGRREDLPELDRYEQTNISIPIHNMLTDDDIDTVIDSIKAGW